MDGTYEGWRQKYNIPTTRRMDDLHITLPDGTAFDMKAYLRLQPKRTEWIACKFHRMLELTRQMPDKPNADRTTKSYLLQAYEATSREAKIRWATRAGHAWLNLQHDGVVIALKPNTTAAQAIRQLSTVSSEALGYAQPVEVKTMDPNVTPQPATHDRLGAGTCVHARTAAERGGGGARAGAPAPGN